MDTFHGPYFHFCLELALAVVIYYDAIFLISAVWYSIPVWHFLLHHIINRSIEHWTKLWYLITMFGSPRYKIFFLCVFWLIGWGSYSLHGCTGMCISLVLKRRFVLQHIRHGNIVKVCNRIIFNLYLGLPHAN